MSYFPSVKHIRKFDSNMVYTQGPYEPWPLEAVRHSAECDMASIPTG